MKDSEVLVVGLLAVVVVAYSLSKKTATAAVTAPASATNPTSTASSNTNQNTLGAIGTYLGDVNQVGTDLSGFLNGAVNNTGSSNSSTGTSQSNGWVDTLTGIA
jgi:hypothetical protein